MPRTKVTETEYKRKPKYNVLTRKLNQIYPRGTILIYHGKTGCRSGMVLKAKAGLLVVKCPATVALNPGSCYGLSPFIERVSEREIRQVIDPKPYMPKIPKLKMKLVDVSLVVIRMLGII